MKTTLFSLFIAVLAIGSTLGLASAQTVLFNFGATVNDNANSPGHAVGGIVGTNWNLITADTPSGIVDDSGAATTVGLELGKETGASTQVLDTSLTGFNNSGLGTSVNSGIYSGNARSGTFVDDGASSFIDIGVRITGLAAGEYNLFLVSRNTNTGLLLDSYTFYAGTVASGSGSTTDYSGFANNNLLNPRPTDPEFNDSNWELANNYQSFNINVAAGEDLVIVASGNRGFFNTIELQQIPEPNAFALLAGGGMLMLMRRRRF